MAGHTAAQEKNMRRLSTSSTRSRDLAGGVTRRSFSTENRVRLAVNGVVVIFSLYAVSMVVANLINDPTPVREYVAWVATHTTIDNPIVIVVGTLYLAMAAIAIPWMLYEYKRAPLSNGD
jgi:hypothetical protein